MSRERKRLEDLGERLSLVKRRRALGESDREEAAGLAGDLLYLGSLLDESSTGGGKFFKKLLPGCKSASQLSPSFRSYLINFSITFLEERISLLERPRRRRKHKDHSSTKISNSGASSSSNKKIEDISKESCVVKNLKNSSDPSFDSPGNLSEFSDVKELSVNNIQQVENIRNTSDINIHEKYVQTDKSDFVPKFSCSSISVKSIQTDVYNHPFIMGEILEALKKINDENILNERSADEILTDGSTEKSKVTSIESYLGAFDLLRQANFIETEVPLDNFVIPQELGTIFAVQEKGQSSELQGLKMMHIEDTPSLPYIYHCREEERTTEEWGTERRPEKEFCMVSVERKISEENTLEIEFRQSPNSAGRILLKDFGSCLTQSEIAGRIVSYLVGHSRQDPAPP